VGGLEVAGGNCDNLANDRVIIDRDFVQSGLQLPGHLARECHQALSSGANDRAIGDFGANKSEE